MNKLNPRNKICLKNNNKIIYLKKKKKDKLTKKKWIFFKKNYKIKKQQIPENRKIFFKKRLIEKQQFKKFYGCLSEYKLKNIMNKSLKNKNILKNFIYNIESHLDINLFRLQKAKTIFHAKQLINHKKIQVNNIIIKRCNYNLKSGDILTLIKNN